MMNGILPALKLDDKGRCCGRKPLVYKTRQDRHTPNSAHKFCPRCDAAFDVQTGEQVENWKYREIEGGFVLRPRPA